MKLIVGLGNPGSQYERTRHNAGFMAIDRLASMHGATNWRSAYESFAADILLNAEKIILLKPMTFMNLSGRAVASAMQFYKLGIDELLVLSDDIALPVGTIRLRPTGSAGGHNGLSDIQRSLSSFATAAAKKPEDYARLRIGIDPPGRVPQKNYVLEPFSKDQLDKLDAALSKTTSACETWIKDGITRAMNLFNAADKDPS